MRYSLSLLLSAACLLGAPAAGAAPVAAASPVAAAKPAPGITRIDPTFWWVGMKNPKLQLLVYGPGIGQSTVSVRYPGVTLEGTEQVENPNYLLVNLTIAPGTTPGRVPLEFRGRRKLRYDYELRARSTDPSRVQGLTAADFIYFLMPDRFANGDPTNDVVSGMQETTLNRAEMYDRHGGDLRGIENHFDYMKELGVTAIWPTPIVENDQPRTSYHGYALTDFYRVDPRYGSNEEYAQFVQHAHQNGLKVIQDVVLNHIGSASFLFRDAPAKDWFHQWPTFTKSNFRDAAFNDPHGSRLDQKQFGEGWFDVHMPDVNQSNPQVATYIIQNNLWWIEYTGLDAYRIDTYAYSDRNFLMQWGKAIQEEYPRLHLFGETWVQGTAQQAYFARNIFPPVEGFKANLPGVTDFQLNYAIQEALTKEPGWTEGVARLYYTLHDDWMYEDATRNVVFLDNHDMSRIFSVVGEDVAKMKMAYAWLLTTRGIPQLYYGTEVLMAGFSNPDGLVRADFPGGFAGDKQNYFTAAGRPGAVGEAFNYVSRLGQYRRAHPVLQTGKLMQFTPDNGVYTYFRYDDAGHAVMVLLNGAKDEKTVGTARMAERLNGFSSATEVVTGATVSDLRTLRIPGHTAWVLELKR